MKTLAIILIFISTIIMMNEGVNQKYWNRIKVSIDVEDHFRKTKFILIEKRSSGSNNSCNDCVFNFKGFIPEFKDTLNINGINSKFSSLLKYSKSKDYLYYDVWYCNHAKLISLIEGADPLKYKPSRIFDGFLKAWAVYLLCLISIIFSIIIFKRKN